MLSINIDTADLPETTTTLTALYLIIGNFMLLTFYMTIILNSICYGELNFYKQSSFNAKNYKSGTPSNAVFRKIIAHGKSKSYYNYKEMKIQTVRGRW